MRVLITGSTGFLGSHLCRRFEHEGYDITILRRSHSDTTNIEDLKLNHVIGDITDVEVVDKAIKGQELVIHAAALVGKQSNSNMQITVNVEGTKNVVSACKKYAVRRLLVVSSVATIGIPSDPDKPADESSPFKSDIIEMDYHISKRQAEEEVLKESLNGLDAVIVNPGWIFGPFGNKFRGSDLIDKIQRKKTITCFRGGVNIVYIDDVVDGIIRAMKEGRSGERYILGGENISFRRLAEVVTESLRLRRIFIPVPSLVTWLAARILEPIGKLSGRRPLLTYDEHYYLNHFHFYNSSKAIKDLGYNSRSFEEIVKEYFLGNY